MEVIYHITERDLETLVQRVVSRLKESPTTPQQVWLTPQETLKRLNLKSKTSLYHLRMNGMLTYTKTHKRIIMYSLASVEAFLERNVHKSF